MSINLFGRNIGQDKEDHDVQRRKEFIERMERKLEFKQSLHKPHYHRYLIR